MKTKEDILNSFNTTGDDASPEMSVADILQAMELYKDQYARAAFNAARETQSHSNMPRFDNYEAYDLNLKQQVQKHAQSHHEMADAIKLAADSILPNFLPADKSQHQLSFDFTMQEKSYRARYHRDPEGYWELNDWDELN